MSMRFSFFNEFVYLGFAAAPGEDGTKQLAACRPPVLSALLTDVRPDPRRAFLPRPAVHPARHDGPPGPQPARFHGQNSRTRNQPLRPAPACRIYFHQFAERAAARGLHYLGEADMRSMVPGNVPPDIEEWEPRITRITAIGCFRAYPCYPWFALLCRGRARQCGAVVLRLRIHEPVTHL